MRLFRTWRAACASISMTGLALVLSISTADAIEFRWELNTSPRMELTGQRWIKDDDSIDTSFRATCTATKMVEIGIGADKGVGTGNHEAVSITLESGGKKVSLKGTSEMSPNSQNTGGKELRAIVQMNHPIFELLQTKTPIMISGALSDTWPVTSELPEKWLSFGKSCVK